jgi:hypothetical protein
LCIRQADEFPPALRTAIADSGAGEVRRIAHRLCGASVQCGVTGLVHGLSALEHLAMDGALDGAATLFESTHARRCDTRRFLDEYLGAL